ncbi:MAG: sugar transferase, partial [Treponemataceae bacterium]|nr:sugar transferase [Treponemataceae bacterium]
MESTFQDFENYYRRNFHRTSSFWSGIVFMLVDAITLLLCIGIGFFIVNFVNHSFINFRSFVEYYVYIPLILIVFYAADLYPGIMTSPAEDVKRLCICTFFGFCGIAMSIFVEDANDKVAVAVALVVAIPFATILLPGMREIMRRFCGKFKSWGLPVVVYCSGNSAAEIIERLLQNPYLGYSPALIVNDGVSPKKDFSGIPIFAPSKDLLLAIKKQKIKVAIIAGYKSSADEIMKNFRYTIVISETQNIMMSGTPHLRDISGIVGFSCTHNLTKKSHLVAKRMIDLAIILFTLPLVLPVSLIIALLVKVTSPGPILYGHVRIGKNHKQIKCWKFRSMYK